MRGPGTFLSAVGSVLLLTSAPALAAPSLRCALAKLHATGVEARARLLCEQRELRSNVLGTCQPTAVARREAAYARADATGVCDETGESEVLGDALVDLILSLRLVLVPGGVHPSRCTAAQLRGAARAIGEIVAAHVRDVRTPDASRLSASLAAARARLAATFARAAAAGDCLSNAPAESVADLLEPAAAGFRNLLLGSCSCWTTAQLAAAFPPGFFDTAGRGGASCSALSTLTSVSASDSCTLFGPVGQSFVLPRGGVAVLDATMCVLIGDTDPSNSGTCSDAPTIRRVTPSEAAVCGARLRASQPYRSNCP